MFAKGRIIEGYGGIGGHGLPSARLRTARYRMRVRLLPVQPPQRTSGYLSVVFAATEGWGKWHRTMRQLVALAQNLGGDPHRTLQQIRVHSPDA